MGSRIPICSTVTQSGQIDLNMSHKMLWADVTSLFMAGTTGKNHVQSLVQVCTFTSGMWLQLELKDGQFLSFVLV